MLQSYRSFIKTLTPLRKSHTIEEIEFSDQYLVLHAAGDLVHCDPAIIRDCSKGPGVDCTPGHTCISHSIACGLHSCVVNITDTRPSLPGYAEVCTIDAVLMAVIACGTAVLGSAPPLAAGLPREARQMQQVDDSVRRGAEQKLVMKRVELRLPDPVGVAAHLHHRLAERPESGSENSQP